MLDKPELFLWEVMTVLRIIIKLQSFMHFIIRHIFFLLGKVAPEASNNRQNSLLVVFFVVVVQNSG